MRCVPTGICRSLAAALLLGLFFPCLGKAATLQWSALPDRERVTITMLPKEGVPGTVGRIDPKGVLVPFTEVPEGLLVQTPPTGAAIFQGSRTMGRALAITTQTPEFGFMVTRQTPKELVIDFFHNPLGARWKPSSKAPTTEVPPDDGVPVYAPPDEAARSLAADPSGHGVPVPPLPQVSLQLPSNAQNSVDAAIQELASASAPQASPKPSVTPAPASAQAPPQVTQQVPPATPQAPAQAVLQQPSQAVAQPPARQAAPAAAPPVAQGDVSAAPQTAPVQEASQVPALQAQSAGLEAASPAQSEKAAPAASEIPGTQPVKPVAEAPIKPFLDSRRETEERAARLPLPEPPMSGAPVFSAPITRDAPPPSSLPSFLRQGSAAAPEGAAEQGGSVMVSPSLGRVIPAPPKGTPGTEAASGAPRQGISQQPLPQQPAPQPAASQLAVQPPDSSQAPAQRQPAPPPPNTPQAVAPSASPAVPPRTEDAPGVAISRDGGRTYTGLINMGGAPDSVQMVQPASPAGQEAASVPVAGTSGAGNATGGKAVPSGGGITAARSGNGTGGNATEPVEYVDKDGNILPPPLDPVATLAEIRHNVTGGDFKAALDKADTLLRQGGLNRNQREETLHVRAEMLFAANKDDLLTHYREITDATNKAINFNPKSNRNAGALLRLGYVNLKLNQIPEAEALFNRMRREFPKDENIPLTYYYWGDYHFNRNELQRAADEFQYVVEKYSRSKYVRESALGLARSFYRLGYYEKAFAVVDYIEKDWGQFYVEYPPFLNMMGDVAFRLGKLDYALEHYWLYANLEPKGDETDIILTRIGDIYAMQREKAGAKLVYEECVNRFPDRDGGLVAMMRLAEEGINDDPSVAAMFGVFDRPFTLRPAEVYRIIIDKHPTSPLVPLAELKLAMWYLWNKDYLRALDACADLLKRFPEHELTPKAQEVALQTFAYIASESVTEERYSRMREIWERYPIVHSQESALPPESRIALGVGYWKDGKPDDALRVVEPFFLGSKVPEYSEMALSLVLSIYLEYEQWNSIREVARRVDLWELSSKSKQQLEYAQALAGENLGESEKVASLWKTLYENADTSGLPPMQKAYAAYFLARDAEKERDWERAYFLGREAYSLLTAQAEKSPATTDTGKIISQLGSLMGIADRTGRLKDALSYSEQYLRYLPESDPERLAVMYRTAGIYKKQGDLDTWRKILTEVAAKAPESVYGRTAASELKGAGIVDDAAKYSPTGQI